MIRFALPALCCASLALAACGGEREPAASDNGNAASTPASGASPGTETDQAAAADSGATDAPATPAADECGVSEVGAFIGQEATSAVRSDIQDKVGHDRIRWIGPDTAVTMDFRPDRLNVMLDEANVITGGKCT